jgi:hypothetical protein
MEERNPHYLALVGWYGKEGLEKLEWANPRIELFGAELQKRMWKWQYRKLLSPIKARRRKLEKKWNGKAYVALILQEEELLHWEAAKRVPPKELASLLDSMAYKLELDRKMRDFRDRQNSQHKKRPGDT